MLTALEWLTEQLRKIPLLLRFLQMKWQTIFVICFIAAIFACAAWVGWSLGSLEPQCGGHWHHVTVPITVNGQSGTEDKWVCQ